MYNPIRCFKILVSWYFVTLTHSEQQNPQWAMQMKGPGYADWGFLSSSGSHWEMLFRPHERWHHWDIVCLLVHGQCRSSPQEPGIQSDEKGGKLSRSPHIVGYQYLSKLLGTILKSPGNSCLWAAVPSGEPTPRERVLRERTASFLGIFERCACFPSFLTSYEHLLPKLAYHVRHAERWFNVHLHMC